MTRTDNKPSQSTAPEVPADVLMSVLGEQIGALHALAQDLETSLSDTLSEADTLSAEAFRTIQRLDYLRQSLKDIGAILVHVGTRLHWMNGQEVRIDALHDIVDMQDSLAGLSSQTHAPSSVHDIWL